MELPTSEDIFLEYLKYSCYETKNWLNASEQEPVPNKKVIF